MNEVTVTMPIKRYEGMKAEIERLKKESIKNFVELSPPSLHSDGTLIGIKENDIEAFICGNMYWKEESSGRRRQEGYFVID